MARITPLSDIVERQYNMDMYGAWGICAGCGGGILVQALARALDRIEKPHDNVALLHGIHCSGSQVEALDYAVMGGLHGRAVAYATGLKLARPELTVITVQGDGDAVGIGGNHFVHAARRNIDITVLVNNNFTYGRTGGQYGPTTPKGAFATSARYGTVDRPIDICKLAEASGATFVARGSTYHAVELGNIVYQAICHRGFSVVDVIMQCPTAFGRYNKGLTGSSAPEMLKWIRNNTVRLSKAKDMDTQELEGKYVIGVFVDKDDPVYGDEYEKIIRLARMTGDDNGSADTD